MKHVRKSNVNYGERYKAIKQEEHTHNKPYALCMS